MTLVTFGCSWTFGVGLHYEEGMTEIDYRKSGKMTDKEVSREYAWRSILAERWGMENKNFAVMGSSNERQFRMATKYFGDLSKQKCQNTTVIWALTVTPRTEVWYNSKQDYVNVLFGNGWGKDAMKERAQFNVKEHITHHYNHEQKVILLSQQIRFWDKFFALAGIKNYWLDTFNHHNYDYKSPNMLFDDKPQRDLLSLRCADRGYAPKADGYHVSQFADSDSSRVPYLVKQGDLNPYSYHPTKSCHAWFADKIYDEIANIRV